MSYENYRPMVRIGKRVGSKVRISGVGEKVKFLPPAEKEDPHHCHCIAIDENVETFKKKLDGLDAMDQFGEDHGQVFGRAFRISEYLQLHIKVMPSREIEAEMEPPPEYPGAHLNQEHSYSAHREVQEVLHITKTPYHLKRHVPTTCIQPVIKKPENPTHITTIIVGVALVAVFAVAITALAKGGRS